MDVFEALQASPVKAAFTSYGTYWISLRDALEVPASSARYHIACGTPEGILEKRTTAHTAKDVIAVLTEYGATANSQRWEPIWAVGELPYPIDLLTFFADEAEQAALPDSLAAALARSPYHTAYKENKLIWARVTITEREGNRALRHTLEWGYRNSLASKREEPYGISLREGFWGTLLASLRRTGLPVTDWKPVYEDPEVTATKIAEILRNATLRSEDEQLGSAGNE